MNNASERSNIGSRSRRDEETSNDDGMWRQLLLSVFSDSSAASGSNLENIIHDNSQDSSCDDNSVEEDEHIGYGSITRNKRRSKDHSSLLSDRESFIPSSDEILRTISIELDERDHLVDQRADENKLARLQHRRRSLVAWMILVFLSCSCLLTFFGEGMLQGPNHGGKRAQVFFFDTLFSGVKKKPSKRVLEQPPPLARSVLLVLRAEVTPENTVVNDRDRQLTANGMRDAEGLGIYLMEHRIPEPDWIFVSPSERTAFTTELIRRHWGSEAPVAFEDILYTLEFNDYFSFVAGLNDQFRRVMIVGHNPAILNSAKKLMKTHGIENFPDCGFMEIRWNNLVHWNDVEPSSGSSTMALDPHNNFYFSTPR